MLALRIRREAPGCDDDALARLYADLVAFWAAGLWPHFNAEHECLLARLVRHVPEHDEHVQRLEHDHLDLAALVADMRDARDIEARRAALVTFGERIRKHVRWEEHALFPLTEQRLTGAELDALGADLDERLPEHPLPLASVED